MPNRLVTGENQLSTIRDRHEEEGRGYRAEQKKRMLSNTKRWRKANTAKGRRI